MNEVLLYSRNDKPLITPSTLPTKLTIVFYSTIYEIKYKKKITHFPMRFLYYMAVGKMGADIV